MADGTVTAPAAAPSDGELAPETKRPADEAARQKEADRARRRRVMDKLKNAKSEDELRKLMQKYSGVAGVDDSEAAGLVPAAPLEPGQRPGWPAPSKVAVIEEIVRDGLSGTAELAETIVTGFVGDPATDDSAFIGVTIAGCFKKDQPAAAKLAEAWAPLIALYAPAWMETPAFAAGLGTVQVGGMVLAAVKAAANERADQLEAQLAKKKAEQT